MVVANSNLLTVLPGQPVLAVTRGDPRALAAQLHTLLRQGHPALVVTNTTTLEDHVGIMLLLRRLSAVASGRSTRCSRVSARRAVSRSLAKVL